MKKIQRNSLIEFDIPDQKRPSQYLSSQTINQFGKTIISIDILDNTNKILKKKQEQRKFEQSKYEKEQELILKKQLFQQNDARLIMEDVKKTKQINEDFRVDLSSIYSTMPAQFPFFEGFSSNNQQNSKWQLITKSIISPQSTTYSQNLDEKEELNDLHLMKRRSNFSGYNSNNDKSFDSNTNIVIDKKAEKQKIIMKEKEKENRQIEELAQRKQRFLQYTLSQNFVDSALKNKNNQKNKFRRLRLGSLEKEVKFKIIENEQEDYQLIQRNRHIPKIYFDKQIILVENTLQKHPPYHPQLYISKNNINLSLIRGSQHFRSLSHFNSPKAQIDKNNKIVEKNQTFRSECELDKHRKRNDIFLESVLDHKLLQLLHISNKKHKQKSPRIIQENQNQINFKSLLNKITRDIRRKSCHCSECGELTTKQKTNFMLVLESEKKAQQTRLNSPNKSFRKRIDYVQDDQRTLSCIQVQSQMPIYSSSPIKPKQKAQTQITSSPSFLNTLPEKPSNIVQSSLFNQQQSAILKQQNEPTRETREDEIISQEESLSQYKSQQFLAKQLSSLSLTRGSNQDQFRYRTETIETDRYQETMMDSQQLGYRPNKLESYKKNQQNQYNHLQEQKRIQSTSPNGIKLKQMLHSEGRNYSLKKCAEEGQQTSRRINQFIKRQIASQIGDSSSSTKNSNIHERSYNLREANQILMNNTQKSIFLKKMNITRNKSHSLISQYFSNNRNMLAPPAIEVSTPLKINQYLDKYLVKRDSQTRKSSDFNSKAYTSHSTFNSTKGFQKEQKFKYQFQDEIEQKAL